MRDQYLGQYSMAKSIYKSVPVSMAQIFTGRKRIVYLDQKMLGFVSINISRHSKNERRRK